MGSPPRSSTGLVGGGTAAGVFAALLVLPSCSERPLEVPHPSGADAAVADLGVRDAARAPDLWRDPAACDGVSTFPPGAPWPMAGRCPDHAGRSPFVGPSAPHLLWSLDTGRPIDAPPAVGPGEVVYLGAADGMLRAIDGPTGAVRWQAPLEAPPSSPTLGPGGALLVGGYTVARPSFFHALDAATGTLRWTYPVFEAFGPTLDDAGRVFFADAERVVALRVEVGDEQGQYRVSGSLGLDPLLVGDSLLCATVRGVESLGLHGGGRAWSATAGGDLVAAPPAAGPDGVVWAGTAEGRVLAFDPASGAVRRRIDVGGRVAGTPAIGADGTAWVGAGRRLVALHVASDRPLRVVEAPSDVLSVILGGDDLVYAGCRDGTLLVVAAGGPVAAVRSSLRLGGALRVRPALGGDGTLYVPCDDGLLYALSD